MATVNRKTRRDRLVSHLTTDCTGTGNPVAKVFGYDKRDFDGQSPVVLVLSEGTGRIPFGIGTSKYDAPMLFVILSFVREADEDVGITAQNTEDDLDNVEASIADSIMAHRKDPPYWYNLMYDGEVSTIIPAIVGGLPYKMEQFIVQAEVKDP